MRLEQSDDIYVATGLGLGADTGLFLLEEILSSCHHSHFEKDENGVYETAVTRVTEIILKHGTIYLDKITEVAWVTLYPLEYFCPLNYYTGKIDIIENL